MARERQGPPTFPGGRGAGDEGRMKAGGRGGNNNKRDDGSSSGENPPTVTWPRFQRQPRRIAGQFF